MNNVAGLQVTSSGDDCISDGATPNTPTLLINFRAAFGVDGSVCAIAFVEAPVCSGDDRIRVLIGNIAGDETQCCLSDFSFHNTRRVEPANVQAQAQPLETGVACND